MKQTSFFTKSRWSLLVVGLLVVAVTYEIGYYSHALNDGLLDIHYSSEPILWTTAIQMAILTILSTIIGLEGLALAFDRNFDAIKLLGHLLIARWPLLIASLCGFFMYSDIQAYTQSIIKDPSLVFSTMPLDFIVLTIISLLAVIAVFFLTYFAVKRNTTMKKGNLALTSIMGLIIGEAIWKILAHFFL